MSRRLDGSLSGVPNTSILSMYEKIPLSRRGKKKLKELWKRGGDEPLKGLEEEWWELRDGEEVRLPARVLWTLAMRLGLHCPPGTEWPRKNPKPLTDYEDFLKYLLRKPRESALNVAEASMKIHMENPFISLGPEYAEDFEAVAEAYGKDWQELGRRCGLGKLRYRKVIRIGVQETF